MKTKEFETFTSSSVAKTEERPKSWLFDHSSPFILFLIGLLGFFIVLLSAVLTGTAFDSIFGIHYVEDQNIRTAVSENFIIVAVLILVYTILGRFIHKSPDYIQILSAVLISRLPFVIFSLFNIDKYIHNILIINISKFRHELYDFLIGDVVVLIIYAVAGLLAMVYSVYLLFKGFRSATGKIGRKEIILFFAGLVLAEMISRGLILVIR